MANPQRLRRVADQIQRELSGLLRTELKDPRVGMITLTGVEVSPDLAYAKVFFTTLADAESLTRIEAGLGRAAGFLRTQLGKRLRLRVTPEIRFEHDPSVERGVRLSQLIDAAVTGKKSGLRFPVENTRATVNGVLLLDKPVGPSSNTALQRAKRLLGAARAGHTGTLDPLASGLLVIALGEATKFSGGILGADKSYRAQLKLGERTETGDAEGAVVSHTEVKVTRSELLAALEHYRGEIEQLPPRYSAIKHRGRPLYAYARRGEHVPRAARRVAIRRLELERFEGNTVDFFVECSKGTYIRALAEDIGAELGCGAHLAALQRASVGPFALPQATTLEALEAISPAERRERLLPLEALLQSRPRLTLQPPLATKFRQGRTMSVDSASGSVAVFGEDAKFLGIGQVDASGTLQPKRLLALS